MVPRGHGALLTLVERMRILLQTMCLDCLPNSVKGPQAPRKKLRSRAESRQQPQGEADSKNGECNSPGSVGSWGASLVPLMVRDTCVLPTLHAASSSP